MTPPITVTDAGRRLLQPMPRYRARVRAQGGLNTFGFVTGVPKSRYSNIYCGIVPYAFIKYTNYNTSAHRPSHPRARGHVYVGIKSPVSMVSVPSLPRVHSCGKFVEPITWEHVWFDSSGMLKHVEASLKGKGESYHK